MATIAGCHKCHNFGMVLRCPWCDDWFCQNCIRNHEHDERKEQGADGLTTGCPLDDAGEEPVAQTDNTNGVSNMSQT